MENASIREIQEKREHECLSEFASYSDKSLGRQYKDDVCDIRTGYQRDRDRIIHSKSFRRLMHKTQVFLAPEGDHYRTRLTHTLEVSQNARTIARALKLNEDLTEAIALGHDLGHTPFGHAGERALDKICSQGFKHSEQSLRVVDVIEKDGKGLNLTLEVRDGIINHRTSGSPNTLEGKIVRLSDKIAYVSHDVDDAIRGKIISEKDIPEKYREVLGYSVKKRLNRVTHDIIIHSEGKNDIIMSTEIKEALFGLRSFLFDRVYTNPIAKNEEKKAEIMVCQLYEYYMKNVLELPEMYQNLINEGELTERVVCDYIAGMTDRYATAKFQELLIPFSWRIY